MINKLLNQQFKTEDLQQLKELKKHIEMQINLIEVGNICDEYISGIDLPITKVDDYFNCEEVK